MVVRFNCEALDNILGGGLPDGVITNIFGPPGSGKTNMCLVAAVDSIKDGKKIIYVDTEGGFSRQRFEQLCNPKELENVILLEPKTFKEQKDAFSKLEKLSKEDIGLIVIDSMVSLYRLELDDEGAYDANKTMSRQLSLLAKICRTNDIPIIITTQIYEKDDKVEISGGDVTKWWAKILLELKRTDNPNHRVAVLRKHLALPEGLEAEFRIANEGLKKAQFNSLG